MYDAKLHANEITDGITAGVEARKQRGMEIAALARIEQKDGFYIVPSQTNPRPTRYKVRLEGLYPTCDCQDFETRGCKCKHIYAVECAVRREQNPDGSTTVTESVTITKTRKTYPQDWPAYNTAQTNEGDEFQRLLADLCATVPAPAPKSAKGGRPPLPIADAVFAVVYKVYSTFSGRRFISDLRAAHADGRISRLPHFNSIFNYLENPEMTPILVALIEQASLPLAAVESAFAFDSTGFAFCRFVRWYDIKYNRFTAEQQWVKAHICTGVKTNTVTAIEIHEKTTNDCPLLPSLLSTTAKNFTVKEASADKGYSSAENHDAIAKVGATPYIMFKTSATGRMGGLFQKAWHYFNYQREAFLAHYHQRSNVESTVMMIKTKFGDAVRSKSDVAAKNEVLCKVLCHNICCLISAIYELGINASFTGAAENMAS